MWPPVQNTITSVNLETVTSAILTAEQRREQCLISPALLSLLGRTLHPDLNFYGQIRVIADAPGRAAVFTIAGINAQPGNYVSVYAEGASKLYAAVPPTLGTATVVSSPASNVTRVLGAGLPESYTMGPAGENFLETVMLRDSELLVVAPHGGSIEGGTSEQAQYLVGLMTPSAPNLGAPTVWYCQGQFSAANFNRLHITSTAIDERTYIGLGEAWRAAPYQGPIRYRYAVSLHGKAGDTLEVVIGGRADAGEKAFIGGHIAALIPGVTLLYESPGIGGSAVNNFINRLSQNAPPFRLNRGAIQIEQSLLIRTGTDPVSSKLYRDLVAEGLAAALTELLARNRVYVRDHLGDDGTFAATPSFMSPDVCIRTPANPPSAATLANKNVWLENESIPSGGQATVWVRAYNANPVLPLSAFHAHVYDSPATTLLQPQMWNPLGVVALGNIGSNSTPTTGSFLANVAATAGHRCLVCLLADDPYDLTVLKNHAQGWNITQFTDFIHRSRLAAWRNFEVVNVAAATGLSVVIPGFDGEGKELPFRLEVVARLDRAVEVQVAVQPELAKRLRIKPAKEALAEKDGFVRVPVPREGGVIDLGRGTLPSKARYDLRFEIRGPEGKQKAAKKLGTLFIRQLYAPAGQPEVEVGRVTWELVVGQPKPPKPTKTRPSAKPTTRAKKKPTRAKPIARAKKAAAKKPARAKKPTRAKKKTSPR